MRTQRRLLINQIRNPNDPDQSYAMLLAAIVNLRVLNKHGLFIPAQHPPPDEHIRKLARERAARFREKHKPKITPSS